MASDVQVCSNALQMLGASPINSFSEGTAVNGIDTARLCGNLWPTTRNSLLRSHPWKCAKTRVLLAAEITPPAFGYANRFVLPGDWMRNVEINGEVADEVDYEIETAGDGNASKRLLMEGDTLKLIYIWRNKDVESWDPMLVEGAELAMAAKMAYAVTQSTSKETAAYTRFDNFMKRARAVDGQDQSPAQLGSFEILGARRAISRNI